MERKWGMSGNASGAREAVARATGELEWNGIALCSLGFHKGLPASQSVSPNLLGLYLVWSVGASL